MRRDGAAIEERTADGGIVTKLNTEWHKQALGIFLAIVLLHWAEHLTQAFQVWVLDSPRPESRGMLGQWFPWLVSSEALHFGYAVVMLAGLMLLRPGFRGAARIWWTVALAIQAWHLVEHGLLQLQAISGTNFFEGTAPTSLVQIWLPRVELHLLYNAVVFVPMVVAMLLHRRASQAAHLECTCAARSRARRRPSVGVAPSPA